MAQKILLCQTQAPTTAAAAFTATKRAAIDAAVVCNPTGADDTLSVWVVQDGGAQADDNAVIHDLTVTAGETVMLSSLVNHVVETGGKIFLEAGTSASALSVMISGQE